MNQSNLTPVDERLRAVLVSAMQRDPNALRNADHLHGLLADLAPDMPADLRGACVVVARTSATNWLTQTPPYSEEQVVAWLRAQFPEMKADIAGQAVAAFALLTGARGGGAVVPATAPSPAPSPVFDQPTVAGAVGQFAAPPPSTPSPSNPPPVQYPPPTSQPTAPPVQFPPPTSQPTSQPSAPPPVQYPPPTSQPSAPQQYGQPMHTGPQPAIQVPPPTSQPPVGSQQTEMPGYPPAAQQFQQYQQPSWPPQPPPTKKSKKTPIILAVVAVLLIGAGVGVWFAVKGGGSHKTPLAAPAGVTTQLDGFGSVAVSWHAVTGADHYSVSDVTGALASKRVTGTSVVFRDAATKDHRFVVQAFRADGSAGTKSVPAPWTGRQPLVAPTDLTAAASGFDVHVSWSAVDGASGYQLRDQADSSFTPDTITGTSYVVPNAVYTSHTFVVSAIAGTATGPASTVATFTPQHVLSAGEVTLALKVPSTLVQPGSCQADTTDENDSTFVTDAVSCEPATPTGADGPQTLFVSQLAGSQNSYESQHFGHMKLMAGCENSYPVSGTHATWTIDSKTIGDEYCYENAGHSVFAWTYYSANIVIQVEGTAPTTRTGLHDWWKARSAALR